MARKNKKNHKAAKVLAKFIFNTTIGFLVLGFIIAGFDIPVTDRTSIIFTVAAVLFVPALRAVFKSIKRKLAPPPVKKSVPAHPAPGNVELHASEPPRQTGNSVYVQLKPSACLSAKDYIMFDTETTGFSSATDRIIEIGAIKCIDDQPVDSFTTFVNPDMHIPSNISRLTGITDADVKDAPQFSEIAKPLMDFIGNLPLVAHNGSFDARMLTAELNFLGLDYTVKVIDTLSLARKAFPDLENHKLRTLIHALGLADHEQQHRALDDARIGHQLYLRCKEELKR